MTATEVNGLTVIADESTELMIAGRMVRAELVRTLLLEDGTTAYGCAKCDYTNPVAGGIPPHAKVHNTKKTKQQSTTKPSVRRRDAFTQQPNELDELKDRLARLEANIEKSPNSRPAGEPGQRVGFFATGMGTWIVLAWKEHNAHMLQAYGFFPNQTAAKKWGAKYFPRRYQVANVATTTDVSVPRRGR